MQLLGEHPTDRCHTRLSVAAIVAHHHLYEQHCYSIGICNSEYALHAAQEYTAISSVQFTQISYIKKLL